jgi:hypothetical protein
MMMTEMLKQLSLCVFGLVLGVAVLAASSDTVFADRSKVRAVEGPRYSNGITVTKRRTTTSQARQDRFLKNLDTETEAVWRNLRPNRFPD